VTRNFVISKPATAPAGNWQASVLYTGLTGVVEGTIGVASPSTGWDVHYSHAHTHSNLVGPLTVFAEGMASDMIPPFSVGALSDVAVGSDAPYRVLAVGVEVHNTTANMYKQGSVTVGILEPFAPDNGETMYVDDNLTTTWKDRQFQCDQLSNIPVNDQTLRLVPSSRTWEAAKGVYMVPRMIAAPLCKSSYAMRDAKLGFSNGQLYHCDPEATSVSGNLGLYPVLNSPSVSGWTPMMALFTGLSDQTTLTVTFKTIVEIFPPANSTLAPMVSPSCPYDPAAIQAYSTIVQGAPYAVPVSENNAGDFFRKVIAAAKDMAPLLGLIPYVGKPLQAAVPAVSAGAYQLISMLERKAKESKLKQNNPQATTSSTPMKQAPSYQSDSQLWASLQRGPGSNNNKRSGSGRRNRNRRG